MRGSAGEYDGELVQGYSGFAPCSLGTVTPISKIETPQNFCPYAVDARKVAEPHSLSDRLCSAPAHPLGNAASQSDPRRCLGIRGLSVAVSPKKKRSQASTRNALDSDRSEDFRFDLESWLWDFGIVRLIPFLAPVGRDNLLGLLFF
jgi:hypothetical protein